MPRVGAMMPLRAEASSAAASPEARALIARREPVVITNLVTPAAANWSLAYLEEAFAAHANPPV